MMSPSPFASFSNAPAVHVEADIVPDLGRWLSERRAHGCVRILLAQRINDVSHHPVEDWSLDELDDADALARVIYATGVREAQATRSALAYGVFALRADRPDPVGRFGFRVDASQRWLEPAAAPSTDERSDLIKLLMGHTDLSARLALGHSRGILDQYERLIEQSNAQQGKLLEQAHARIAVLEAREVEALELRDKLQSFALERERESLKARERTEVLRTGLDQLIKSVPLILAGLAAMRGQGPGAPRPSSIEEPLAAFLSSLTNEQAHQLAAILRPDQLALLARIHEIIRAQAAPGEQPSAAADPSDAAPEASCVEEPPNAPSEVDAAPGGEAPASPAVSEDGAADVSPSTAPSADEARSNESTNPKGTP